MCISSFRILWQFVQFRAVALLSFQQMLPHANSLIYATRENNFLLFAMKAIDDLHSN